MTDHTTQEIPYGYCHCGCGQKTNISNYIHIERGIMRGEPYRYLYNHHGRKPPPPLPNPSGLCQCGCGKPAPIALKNHHKSGYVAGQPKRFIVGHGGRGRQRRRISIEERFWQHVTPGPFDLCWEWQSTRNDAGYGTIRTGGSQNRRERAHRVSWEIHFGPIPDGMIVCHKCDNRPCCNPYHLFLGTAADNIADCAAKGRARGGKPKLTADDVLAIRAEYAAGYVFQYELAEKYGVSQSAISAIVRGEVYKHVTPDDFEVE